MACLKFLPMPRPLPSLGDRRGRQFLIPRPALTPALTPAVALAVALAGTGLAGAWWPATVQAQEPAVSSPAPTSQSYRPPSFAEIARTQLDTVVNISTTQRQGGEAGPRANRGEEAPELPPGSPFEEFFREFRDRQRGQSAPPAGPAMALGSGFVVDPAGFVVTNHHVVAEASEIAVTLHDGTRLPARLVGSDEATDMALLKVEAGKPLAAARWGDSERVQVGDWVVAIGNPFGLGGSVTAGILSARARDIQQGPYDEYLQTDAAINRGNSGGPLYNIEGEIIGVNTAIYSPTGGSVGIGFAVPSSLAKPVIEQLKSEGKVRRGWLGVQVQRLTPDIAESLGMADPKGALVTSVAPEGPAYRAGIRQGDVITGFDGKPVDQMRQLPRVVATAEIGKSVPMSILRGGRPETIPVTVGELKPQLPQVASAGSSGAPPSSAAPVETKALLGLKLAPLTPGLRESFSIAADVEGLVVTEVGENTAASDRGLDLGDVIVEAGQEPVKTPDDLNKRIDRARGEGRKTLLMLISRNGDLRYVPLPLEDRRG